MTGQSTPDTRTAARLLGVAQVGQAGWFFGNLYEAVVPVPDHLPPVGTPLASGSPVRYYAAAGPAAVPTLLAAAALGWPAKDSRAWLALSAACTLAGVAATAHLVRTVNLRLFQDTGPVAADERAALLRRWHRVNAVRLALTGVAWLAAGRARAGLRGRGCGRLPA
ncbi:MAG TPA: anthrone oxygenase family protein [Pseudonocardiaceae bacterium]|nr:anthrone oxygenase family protein [Pseudonocardiaceae bacterium]